MGTLDLGDFEMRIGDPDDEERRRRAAQMREEAGYGDAALGRALQGLQSTEAAPPTALPASPVHVETTPERGPTWEQPRGAAMPAAPADAARVGEVEARLQAGDAAGVERDARRDMEPPQQAEVTPMPAAPRQRASISALAEHPRDIGNPLAAGAKAVGGVREQRDADQNADALIERWDRRINEVQTMMQQARDQRTRAVLGGLLSNLVMGAAYALGGARMPGGVSMDADAFERRARERLSDRAREWGASDDMLIRAQELRDERRGREEQRVQRGETARREQQTIDLQRMREERQGRIADARMRLAEAQSDQERQQWMQRLRREDPETGESERARQRFVVTVMGLPPSVRAGYGQSAAEVAGAVQGMSAADIEALESRLPRVSAGVRTSRAGSGGGAPRDMSGLLSEADAVGIPRATSETMTPRELARAIEMRGRRGRDTEGEEILPGVRAGIALSPGEGRAIRQSFAEMRSQMGALGEIDGVARRYGASAAIDRRAAGELAAPIASLRAMVARLQNTGVINPSEAPAIEAMLPNPQNLAQMTFGDLQQRLRSFRGALERAVDGELEARGVDDEGRARALGMLRGRSGGSATSGATSSAPQRFTVTSPDGRSITRALTDEQRQTLEGAGYTVTEAR